MSSFNPADFDKYENYELEKKFYEDQINQRVMYVSEEIDKEYEEDRSLRIAQLQDAENSFQMEMPFIFDKNEEVNSNQDNPQEVSESATQEVVLFVKPKVLIQWVAKLIFAKLISPQ